jgi:hypothetical protein
MDTQLHPNATTELTLADLGYYTEDQIIQLFKISRNTCVDWRKRGTGPAYSRRGNQFFYHPDDLKVFIKANRQESAYTPKVEL